MQLEVGMILEGKVSGITKYGAFVDLPGNKTGMVHISEISSSFVNDISDYIKENQQVKVKVININENGKIALSIKALEAKKEIDNRDKNFNKNKGKSFNKTRRNSSGPGNFEWRSKKSSSNNSVSFEDMLSKFKQSSEEKMSDLKKFTDVKRANSRRNSNLPK